MVNNLNETKERLKLGLKYMNTEITEDVKFINLAEFTKHVVRNKLQTKMGHIGTVRFCQWFVRGENLEYIKRLILLCTSTL